MNTNFPVQTSQLQANKKLSFSRTQFNHWFEFLPSSNKNLDVADSGQCQDALRRSRAGSATLEASCPCSGSASTLWVASSWALGWRCDGSLMGPAYPGMCPGGVCTQLVSALEFQRLHLLAAQPCPPGQPLPQALGSQLYPLGCLGRAEVQQAGISTNVLFEILTYLPTSW